MLNLAKGYKIYEPKRLDEEYEVTDDVTLMANVDVEKIKEVFQHFIVMHDEPLFFILELPVTCDRENPVAPGILEETHKDVYYIDGCSQEECLVLLERYGELLINDGMNRFGYGCHESQDEIMLDKYNVITIYSQQLSNYSDFFEAHGIITLFSCHGGNSFPFSDRQTCNGKTGIAGCPENQQIDPLHATAPVFASENQERMAVICSGTSSPFSSRPAKILNMAFPDSLMNCRLTVCLFIKGLSTR